MADPLTGVKCAVKNHPEAFDGDDRKWLADAVSASRRRWREFDFYLPRGLIHGDAHPNNVLYTPHGALLGDWDHVSAGPREWDLVQSLYFHRRFPAVGADPQTVAEVYGWDLRSWPEADELIAVREISGLGAYARTAAFKPAARAELAYRIQTLRQNDTLATWNSPSSL
jgi:aminoglycoside phosphotransferase (APT) family kinase protein